MEKVSCNKRSRIQNRTNCANSYNNHWISSRGEGDIEGIGLGPGSSGPEKWTVPLFDFSYMEFKFANPDQADVVL